MPPIDSLGNIWSAFDAIRHVRYSFEWSNVVSPETRILDDARKRQPRRHHVGRPERANSTIRFRRRIRKRISVSGQYGPEWVASVVNAIGEGRMELDGGVRRVDDWGGWYDHVTPPQLDRMGLGFRVPFIAIGPYA